MKLPSTYELAVSVAIVIATLIILSAINGGR